ncbi:MAG TPA: hypothetical protein PKE63_04330 [Lacibacter sp.]|nr:hypothetical protein [Lacibacter sp.]HMO89187.1 hypothetical protein [Lacibacter sp.]HMP86478.1 hypothetical protein [Lacibacter sp.]
MAAKLYKRWQLWHPMRWKRRTWLLLLPLVLITGFHLHPYYVSVTELDYRPEEKQLQIACKIFTDDLEEALRGQAGRRVDLLKGTSRPDNDTLVVAYLRQHLKIMLDGKTFPFRFVGSEINEDATWNYLLIEHAPAFSQATVFIDILYKERKDQINILHFRNRNQRQSYRLVNPDDTHTFRW